jgi:hypothetical protein
MANVIIFVLASALLGLFFSRIHFHFSFNLTISRQGRPTAVKSMAAKREAKRRGNNTSGEVEAPAVRSISDRGVTKALEAAKSSVEADLYSALLNLGCKAQKAREVASKAILQAPDFDGRLKWAIQNAA